MENQSRKDHWEKVYQTKNIEEVSWYQPKPEISLSLIKDAGLPLSAKIIDVGGGDSFLVDHLIDLGYEDITVLDISETALSKAKKRLGKKAEGVKWIVADAASFEPTEQYDIWHDRAAFHFLTQEHEINHYVNVVEKAIKPGGVLILGTFSEDGPKKCSGLDIQQYSESSMAEKFGKILQKEKCMHIGHPTPFNTSQEFIFCVFRKQ
jgi:SAM-dependent methyltransferase